VTPLIRLKPVFERAHPIRICPVAKAMTIAGGCQKMYRSFNRVLPSPGGGRADLGHYLINVAAADF